MEGFFKISSSIDLIEIEELLLRKYNIEYILKLDFVEGLELINKAIEKEIDHNLWQRWLVDYAHMDKDSFIPFETYKEKLLGNKHEDNISKEELLKIAEEIESKISQKRGESNGN